MLTRLNKILIGMLVVQVVLVVVVLARGGQQKLVEQPLLAGFDSAAVTRVQVYGEGGTGKPSVDLVKHGTDWVLASGFDYPADPIKVIELLAPIAKLAAAEPVATSSARHKQLKVADGEFERKLVLTAGGKDTVIYVGTSAGLRRTAVRIGNADNVYGVTGLSTGTMGTQDRDWVKLNYYDVPRDDIAKITIQKGTSAVELEHVLPPAAGSGSAPPPPPAADDYKLAIDGAPVVLAAGETLDKFAIDTIVSNVATIPAQPANPKRDDLKLVATIVVQRKAATDTLDVVDAGEQYWVKERKLDRATLVDKDRLKAVIEAARDKLVAKPPAPAPAAGSGSATPAPAKLP